MFLFMKFRGVLSAGLGGLFFCREAVESLSDVYTGHLQRDALTLLHAGQDWSVAFGETAMGWGAAMLGLVLS